VFRFIRPPLAVVGNETVAEDTLADGETKAVALTEVELADVEGHQQRTSRLELDAAFVLVFLFFFFSSTVQRHFHRMQHLYTCAIRSCLSNAVAAAVLFQSNSTAMAACRALRTVFQCLEPTLEAVSLHQ
jgi:hypothetical protein